MSHHSHLLADVRKAARADLRPGWMITVCDACFTASCWQGKFYCESYKTAGTTKITIAEAKRRDKEHPSAWFDDESIKRHIESAACARLSVGGSASTDPVGGREKPQGEPPKPGHANPELSRERIERLIKMDAVPNYIVAALLDEIDRLNALIEPKATPDWRNELGNWPDSPTGDDDK